MKLGEDECVEEILSTLRDDGFHRSPDLIRALVPACISFQIPVKLGVKLVAQTAALFWSVEHVLCNFEVGIIPFQRDLTLALFLMQWMRAVERDDLTNISEEDRKIFTLLRDLVLEADPEGDDAQEISSRFLFVKAYQFNGTNVWGSMFLFIYPAEC
jgi:hypothetical protein